MELQPKPRSVNNFVDKIIIIYVREEFDGCHCGTYTGRVVDILSQGVTINPIPSEEEVIDHIPWSNIRAIRHTSHIESVHSTEAVAVEAQIVTDQP